MLISKISAFFTSFYNTYSHKHIIVALSGGVDSVVLFRTLLSLRSAFGFTVSAVHINHNLRGKESTADAHFVKEICAQEQVDLAYYKLDSQNLKNSENALRDARYTKYAEALKKYNNAIIATGHHLDDQLETFLMRLFMGSRPKGLKSIPAIRLPYIRPMLHVSKEEIISWTQKNKIAYREDSTNAQTKYTRNKIRHTLLPILQDVFGESYLQGFNLAHNRLSRFYDEVKAENIALFKRESRFENRQISISLQMFSRWSENQQIQFLEYCFSKLYSLPFLIAENKLMSFLVFVNQAQTGTFFDFSQGFTVLKERATLIFSDMQIDRANEGKLYPTRNVQWKNVILSIQQVQKAKPQQNSLVEYISGDNLQFPLTIKEWCEGDYFYPLGGKGKQKVSDFFINNKLNRLQKTQIPLIWNKDEIIWVGKMRLDERYKIDNSTKNIYKIEILEI